MPSDGKKFAQDFAFLFGGAAGACLTSFSLRLKQFFNRLDLRLISKNTDEAYLPESTHPEGDRPAFPDSRYVWFAGRPSESPGTMRIGITATADNATPVTIYVQTSVEADRSGFEAKLE